MVPAQGQEGTTDNADILEAAGRGVSVLLYTKSKPLSRAELSQGKNCEHTRRVGLLTGGGWIVQPLTG